MFDGAFSAAFSQDGRRIVTGGANVSVFDTDTGAILHQRRFLTDAQRVVAFSPSGDTVATSGDHFHLWDLRTDQVRSLIGHQETVTSIEFSPDGQMLLSGSLDRTVKLWSVRDGILVRSFTGHQGGINAISFAPDGQHFASVGNDGTSRLWQTNTGQLLVTSMLRDGGWLSITPDGRFVTSTDPTAFLAIVKENTVLPTEEFVRQNRRSSLDALFAR
jgi:WD40 repeat protein